MGNSKLNILKFVNSTVQNHSALCEMERSFGYIITLATRTLVGPYTNILIV